MESRLLKIQFTKSGKGNYTPRMSIPTKWVKSMGIDEDNKEVVLSLLNNMIVLRKKNEDIATIDNTIEEKNNKKINFSKGGSGSLTAKITIPLSYVEHIGVTLEEREVAVNIDDNVITIVKTTKHEENKEEA